jgi:hypothetical protein
MPAEVVAVWPILNRLQEQARRLEKEITALRADVERVAQAFDHLVAVYEVDGKDIVITKADVETVRARLTQPRSDDVIKALALAEKIGELRQHLPSEERERLFWENVEAIRAQAIADGTAIDDPMEVATW